jgi:CAAX prenyl protease-like protein
MARGEGHGWWAYWLPYFAFLALAQFAPADAAAAMLPVKVALPGALLLWYASRGHYAELRGYGWRRAPLDFAVGLLGAAFWMAPYLAFPSLRPDDPGFDPHLYGESRAWLGLGLRGLGYGVVTPFMEELFVRSWFLRYVQVLESGSRRRDFRDLPVGRYTRMSFAALVVWFTFSHAPWEWPVAAGWIIGTQLWFYRRRHLMSMVVAHAGSNLGILAAVGAASGGAAGDLWFFV